MIIQREIEYILYFLLLNPFVLQIQMLNHHLEIFSLFEDNLIIFPLSLPPSFFSSSFLLFLVFFSSYYYK